MKTSLKFPVRPWLAGQRRPSDVILIEIFRREILRRKRRGTPHRIALFETEDWFNEEQIRVQYNLPKESVKYTLTYTDWQQYVKLNSFQKTRREALEFLNQHKHPSMFQD